MGFEWTFYDVSEHEAAKVCVGVLNGTLFDDVSMQIISYGGTAGDLAVSYGMCIVYTSFCSLHCVHALITDLLNIVTFYSASLFCEYFYD